MGFLKKLFGNSNDEATAAEIVNEENSETSSGNDVQYDKQRQAEIEFETLRDDGLRAMRMGQLAYAENCFAAALERKDDEQVWGHMAELYIRAGVGERALPILQALLEKHPDQSTLWMAQAQAARQCSDWETLEKAAMQLSAMVDDKTTVNYFNAEAQYGKQNHIAAVAILTQILSEHPESPDALMLRARILMDMQQYSEAEKDIDVILDHQNDNEDAWLMKGQARSMSGDYEGALAAYNALKDVNPFSQDAALQIGRIQVQLDQLDEALKTFDEIISTWPDYAIAYKERGALRMQLHDNLGAADDMKKMLELSPDTAATINGEFNSMESEMNARYKAQNPFGF